MIRPYRPSDRSALLEIFRLNTPRWFFLHEQKDLEEFLDTHGGTYFVAGHDGKVVGGGGYRVVGPATGRISWYMFHPDFQGKGLGSKQVKHALALLREMPGLEKIEVSTSQLQFRFYEKFGFVTVETKADFWGPGMDLVRMEMAR